MPLFLGPGPCAGVIATLDRNESTPSGAYGLNTVYSNTEVVALSADGAWLAAAQGWDLHVWQLAAVVD